MRVSTATSPGQGTAMLAAEPFRCVVVDLGMPTALEFLDQVREKPDLREIPVLAHAPGEPGADMRDRLAALRCGYPSLELLPSLDDLRERITLHLSAAQPGQVPPARRRRRGARHRARGGHRATWPRWPTTPACAASTCS